jgi:hypothetical protein
VRKNVKKLSPHNGRGGKKDRFSDVVMVMLTTEGKPDSYSFKSPNRLKGKKRKSG